MDSQRTGKAHNVYGVRDSYFAFDCYTMWNLSKK